MFPRAVSLGVALRHELVDPLPGRADPAVAVAYRRDAYELVNVRLDRLSGVVAEWLAAQGHRAKAVPASQRTDGVRICGAFSHKLAARLAGLGWIGKSCLLVTPEAGPRVRWTTVLTDAPLAPAATTVLDRCGDCRACVDICPVRAFTGRAFRPDEPREARYDAGKCDRYFQWMRRRDPATAVCGLCLYVCPHGRDAGAAQTPRLPLSPPPSATA
jgi:epoxyqueuosine reductase QueG